MNRIIQITRRYLTSMGVSLLAFLYPAMGLAQGFINDPPQVADRNPFVDLPTLLEFLRDAVGWLLAFGLIIAVGMIIWGGIKYVTAGGNQEKAGEGAKIVGYSLLGVAIMVLAFALVNIVASIFNADTTSVIGG